LSASLLSSGRGDVIAGEGAAGELALTSGTWSAKAGSFESVSVRVAQTFVGTTVANVLLPVLSTAACIIKVNADGLLNLMCGGDFNGAFDITQGTFHAEHLSSSTLLDVRENAV
jgi:hypothetical protein